jgi:hypothetical protein
MKTVIYKKQGLEVSKNEAGEMINIIGVMIEANLSIYQVMSM